MKLIDLTQGNDSWLAWRRRGLGGSDAPTIVNGKHFGRTRLSLWQEKTAPQGGEKTPENWAMRQGKRTEAGTRAWYEALLGVRAPAVCGVHDQYDFLKASFDGLSDCGSAVLEIKYANRDDHTGALEGKIPDKYRPQLDHLLLVSGRTRLDYASHNPRFEDGARFALVTYDADPERLKELLRLEKVFWQCVASKTPPEDGMFVTHLVKNVTS